MDDQLFQACEEGNTSKFQELLRKNGSIIDQKTVGSLDSPLHLASRFNRTGLATAILDLRLHMATATNAREETPLHEACRVGGLEIVRQLLVASPSVVYLLNGANQSALFIACSHGRSDVALELCNRMTSFASDEAGSLAALLMAASEGSTEIVQKILGENPSLASRKDENENGFSALHYASFKGNLEVVQEILGRNPNLSCLRDNDGRTPLHWAVICKKVPVVEEFLSERRRPASFNSVRIADLINIADHNGDTVLHLAARMNCLEIVEVLLKKQEMKVNEANKEGKTALDILKKQVSARDDADCSCKRFTIIHQLKSRKRANPASMTTMQQTLMVVAALIVTVTFQAGLNPPGGMWQESGRGKYSHKPGKAIQSKTAPWLFAFFMASDALGFIVSLALIPIIMILRKEMLMYVNSLVVAALISVEVAFILGLIMISDRNLFYRVDLFLIASVTFGGICWTSWKLKPGRSN